MVRPEYLYVDICHAAPRDAIWAFLVINIGSPQYSILYRINNDWLTKNRTKMDLLGFHELLMKLAITVRD